MLQRNIGKEKDGGVYWVEGYKWNKMVRKGLTETVALEQRHEDRQREGGSQAGRGAAQDGQCKGPEAGLSQPGRLRVSSGEWWGFLQHWGHRKDFGFDPK